MRAAIYGRVSTKDKGQEVENQLTQLREYCNRSGWEVVREYIDKSSGKSTDGRDEFKAMFSDASKRQFDVVLFWSLDRFSREGALPTMKLLEKLDQHGVAWKSYTEQYLDSCGVFKDAVLSILATIAKQERIRLSERTVAGLERARRAGKTLGRPRKIWKRDQATDMRSKGSSLGEIAKQMGLAKTTVARYCKEAA